MNDQLEIGVIGLGRLGLAFALNCANSGITVFGNDTNTDYINSLSDGTFKTFEPQILDLQNLNLNHYFTIVNSIPETAHIIFVFVATPSLPTGDYDHSQVERVIQSLVSKGKAKEKTTLVIGCTVMPGYCSSLQARLKQFNY